MGKPIGKKKKLGSSKAGDTSSKHSKSSAEHSPRVLDADASIFIDMSNEMKEEGNKLFQRRDYEGALLKYEKAVKLLPKSHVDVAYLRSNIAACYMQMTPSDYYRAINECNLALEVSPKYSKALLKRSRCLEALNRLELAYKDVDLVLRLEPNNLTALEISDRLKKALEGKGIKLDDKGLPSVPELFLVKEKVKRKKSHKAEDKMVVQEKKVQNVKKEPVKEEPPKAVKLVFREDIRWAQIPANCSMVQLREIVLSKFPNLKAVLVKYKDKDGDLVTITTPEELKWAEESAEPQGSVRLYIVEVNPDQDPFFGEAKPGLAHQVSVRNPSIYSDFGSVIIRHDEDKGSSYIDDWILQFAQLFKNHLGFNSDGYLDLHELGMKVYTEAIEETVTSEEAQSIFDVAEDKFQEMAALAMFNWGNVHTSRARKRLFLSEDAPRDSVLEQVKTAYEWARSEYGKAGKRYGEALAIKPDFYEALFALGQQQFEEAKLSWYFVVASKIDFESFSTSEVLELFNNAEDNMERGTEIFEEMEAQRVKGLSKYDKEKPILEEMGLDGLFKDLSPEEATEQASNMRSQVNLLWGTMLYERSIMEFKIGLPTWEECLMAAVDKFKLAGASSSDIAVMIKNHFANRATQEGLAFKIEEIVQAWNEMYDAKRWISGLPSFRLEPLFRRKIPKLHQVLEQL